MPVRSLRQSRAAGARNRECRSGCTSHLAPLSRPSGVVSERGYRANTGQIQGHSRTTQGKQPQAARVGRKQGKERAGPDRSVACGAHGMPKLRWQAQGRETASQLAGPRWGDSETPRSPLSPGGIDGAPTHLPVRFSVAVAEANRKRKRQKPESVLSTCSCRRRICVFVYL